MNARLAVSLGLGLIFLLAPAVSASLPEGASLWLRWPVAALILGGLALYVAERSDRLSPAQGMLGWTVLVFCAVHLTLPSGFAQVLDLRPAARVLGCADRLGLPIGTFGEDHEQYAFLARLQRPTETIYPGMHDEWRTAHADGVVVVYDDQLSDTMGPVFYQEPHRSRTLSIYGPQRQDSERALASCVASGTMPGDDDPKPELPR